MLRRAAIPSYGSFKKAASEDRPRAERKASPSPVSDLSSEALIPGPRSPPLVGRSALRQADGRVRRGKSRVPADAQWRAERVPRLRRHRAQVRSRPARQIRPAGITAISTSGTLNVARVSLSPIVEAVFDGTNDDERLERDDWLGAFRIRPCRRRLHASG
jgi:hypothetical protein